MDGASKIKGAIADRQLSHSSGTFIRAPRLNRIILPSLLAEDRVNLLE